MLLHYNPHSLIHTGTHTPVLSLHSITGYAGLFLYYTHSHINYCILVFSVFPKDTLTCGPGKPRIEPSTLRLLLDGHSKYLGLVTLLQRTTSPQGSPKVQYWDLFSLPYPPPHWARSSDHMASQTTAMLMIPSSICHSHLTTTVSALISDCLSSIPTKSL